MTLQAGARFKIWAMLIAIFALGCITGAALDGIYRSRAGAERSEAHRRDPAEHFETMRRDLSLTDEQATAIRAILEETRNEFRALRAEVKPRYDEVRGRARVRMRALLTPEQQQRFDARLAELDAQRQERERTRH